MNSNLMASGLYYLTGDEIHAGDRVQHGDTFATVVFAGDGTDEELAPGYEDLTGSDRGVIICDDDGDVVSIGEPDDRLSLIDRA
jgi:hypothetical protein